MTCWSLRKGPHFLLKSTQTPQNQQQHKLLLQENGLKISKKFTLPQTWSQIIGESQVLVLFDEVDHDHPSALQCHPRRGGGTHDDHRRFLRTSLGTCDPTDLAGGDAAEQKRCLGMLEDFCFLVFFLCLFLFSFKGVQRTYPHYLGSIGYHTYISLWTKASRCCRLSFEKVKFWSRQTEFSCFLGEPCFVSEGKSQAWTLYEADMFILGATMTFERHLQSSKTTIALEQHPKPLFISHPKTSPKATHLQRPEASSQMRTGAPSWRAAPSWGPRPSARRSAGPSPWRSPSLRRGGWCWMGWMGGWFVRLVFFFRWDCSFVF